MSEKVSILLVCPKTSLEGFIAVNDYNTCTAPVLCLSEKGILEFARSTTNIMKADCNDENEMNNAVPHTHSSHVIQSEEHHESM
ncbi:hypothetical protein TNCV_3477571 [Trichonephila clavipes]|nr:hypothetical protein TNCV_3477571 [Trichonephila clavipes]